ncbi:ATP-binding protein, partial [Rhodopseudomonas sp. B29]|uniref:ATP-binding protein n=1 Tax=Rhodopseudomonas sp. B29 TaxID=95607 RepID=UPI0003B3D7C8
LSGRTHQDYGVISTPHVPVIRVSTPVYAPDGSVFGALIINIDLRSVFRSLAIGNRPGTMVYAINDRGDYLLTPDRTREFGFEFGTPFRIQDDYPQLAAAVRSGTTAPKIVEQDDGSRFGVGFASVVVSGVRPMAIVQILPERTILGAIRNAGLQSVALGGGLALIAAAILSVLLARSMTRPLSKMTSAVQRFGAGGGIDFPQDAAGEIGVLARAFTAMAHDVRHTSDSLRREKEVFETIMNAVAEAVILFDADANIVYENPASMAMRSSEEGGTQLPFDQAFETFQSDGVTLIPFEERPSRRGLRGERLEMQELVGRLRGTDRMVNMLSSALPIVGASGRIDGVVLVVKDITALKDAERRLHQAQKLEAIGQLTGGVAHDFNNMLTVISGTAEILLEQLTDRPDLAALARMIDQASERGADLTRQLLAFARKQPLQPRSVDVNSVVDNIRQLLRPTLGEHIEIEAQLAADAETAMIDPSQLSSALLNLAVNARDAMPDGGKLLFETANTSLDDLYAQQHPEVNAGRYVMIAVSDTGSGMAPDVLQKAFEPFFTTKGLGKGTGLGLSMVYGFVKQSNGHVSIYSEPGQGTTIRLYLPLAESAAEPAPAVMPSKGGSETILLVEDDELVRTFAAAQLRGLGYHPIAVADGREALELARRGTPFDLLFTDVIMPGGFNGPQLAAAIARIRPVRVLYTSGYTENAIVHHGRLDVGVLLLAKPYSRSDLARMVRMALTSDLTPAAKANAAG